ncbi:MAG: holin [Patescibacteria group bacterium]|nr:holin [Patescibacteria group bacterium]
MDLLTLSNFTIAAIPITVGLSAIARQGGVPDRFSPIADIAFGIVLVFLVGVNPWQADVVQGLLVGLSAAGLYNAPQIVTGRVGKLG